MAHFKRFDNGKSNGVFLGLPKCLLLRRNFFSLIVRAFKMSKGQT